MPIQRIATSPDAHITKQVSEAPEIDVTEHNVEPPEDHSTKRVAESPTLE